MNTNATTVILPASSDPLRLAYAGFLARYAGTTLDSYRIHLDLWLRWCTQVGLDPLQARRPHVEIWLRSLEDRHLASATRAGKFGVVHLFYKYAVIDEITDRDPGPCHIGDMWGMSGVTGLLQALLVWWYSGGRTRLHR